MNKRLIAIVLAVITVLTQTISAYAAAPAAREIKVYLDGQPIYFPDQKPIIENNRTLVPVRFVSEALGAEVDWVQSEQKVKITKDTDNIELVIGSKIVKVGSKPIELDVAAKILNSRTLVPLRFVSETLKAKVDWNQEQYTVAITTKDIPDTDPGYQIVNGFKTKTEETTSLTQLEFFSEPDYPLVCFNIEFREGGWSTWKVIPEAELNAQLEEARAILVQRFSPQDVDRLLKYGKTLWDNPIAELDGEKVWRTIDSSYIISTDKKLNAVISSGYGDWVFGIDVYSGSPASCDKPLK